MSGHWGDILPERQKKPSILRSLFEYSMASIGIISASFMLGWLLWQASQLEWYHAPRHVACIIVTNGQVCGEEVLR